MNWRTHLTPNEIEVLTALEAHLRNGYSEELWNARHSIIALGMERARRV